jgi:hypothetical protein
LEVVAVAAKTAGGRVMGRCVEGATKKRKNKSKRGELDSASTWDPTDLSGKQETPLEVVVVDISSKDGEREGNWVVGEARRKKKSRSVASRLDSASIGAPQRVCRGHKWLREPYETQTEQRALVALAMEKGLTVWAVV